MLVKLLNGLHFDPLDLRPKFLDLFADLVAARLQVALLVEVGFDLVFDILEVALEATYLVLELVGLRWRSSIPRRPRPPSSRFLPPVPRFRRSGTRVAPRVRIPLCDSRSASIRGSLGLEIVADVFEVRALRLEFLEAVFDLFFSSRFSSISSLSWARRSSREGRSFSESSSSSVSSTFRMMRSRRLSLLTTVRRASLVSSRKAKRSASSGSSK